MRRDTCSVHGKKGNISLWFRHEAFCLLYLTDLYFKFVFPTPGTPRTHTPGITPPPPRTQRYVSYRNAFLFLILPYFSYGWNTWTFYIFSVSHNFVFHVWVCSLVRITSAILSMEAYCMWLHFNLALKMFISISIVIKSCEIDLACPCFCSWKLLGDKIEMKGELLKLSVCQIPIV